MTPSRRSQAASRFALAAALAFSPAGPRAQAPATSADVRTPASPRLVLAPCTLEDVEGRAECGTFRVYENRPAQNGRQIDLDVVVLRALDGKGAREPLLALQGGPGQAVTPLADFYARIFRAVRTTRDIVLMDHRGTGRSHLLKCDFVNLPGADPGRLLPPDAVRACRTQLERAANLRFYTTEMIVGDIDELRQALGADAINIYGTSYGSRVAFEYIRRHQGRARAVVMKGVVPPGQTAPLFHARDGQRALDRLFARCTADAACRMAYPTLAADVQALFSMVEKTRPRVTFTARDGAARRVTLTRPMFGEAFRNLLYNPDAVARAPLLIRRALDGDLMFFAQAYDSTRRGMVDSIAAGMFLSVTCSEDVPSVAKADIRAFTAGTFLGDMRIREQVEACREWVAAGPSSVQLPLHATVPVLMFSGEDDPVTPPSWGERARATLPNARHVVVPNNGHSWGSLGECGSAIASAFVERASGAALDTSCVKAIPPRPFALPQP